MKKVAFAFIAAVLFITPVWSADIRIESIGALGGQNLYFVYLTLGYVTEAYEKGAADPDSTRDIARNVLSSCKRTRSYFLKLLDQRHLTGEDAQLGKQILDAYDALISQGNALISVIETRNSDTIRQLERSRTSSWGKIETILRLNE